MPQSRDLIALLFIIAVFAFLALFGLFSDRMLGRDLVESWAKREELVILSCRRRLFFKGPFFLRGHPQSNRANRFVVFRIRVRTSNTEERSAYVCCLISTASSDGDIQVTWD